MQPNDRGGVDSGESRPTNHASDDGRSEPAPREWMDHERVAALHDGRLGPRERDELLNELLSNDDEYELFAETAAVLRELEEAHAGAKPPSAAAAPVDFPAPAADADSGVIPLASRRPPEPVSAEVSTDAAPDREDGVIPIGSRRPGRTRWMAYGALAAGIAGLALAAALLTNRGNGSLDDPRLAVATLEDGAARGPAAGWDELWSSGNRGASSDTALARLSVRLGAYMVDLELANAARDTPTVRLVSGSVAELLDGSGLLGSSSAASIYHSVAQGTGTDAGSVDSLLAQGREALRARMAKEWLELGVWAETARTAAARQDAAFFRSRVSRDALERLDALLTRTTSADELAEVRRALPADGRADWKALETALRNLLRSAAGFRRLAVVAGDA